MCVKFLVSARSIVCFIANTVVEEVLDNFQEMAALDSTGDSSGLRPNPLLGSEAKYVRDELLGIDFLRETTSSKFVRSVRTIFV